MISWGPNLETWETQVPYRLVDWWSQMIFFVAFLWTTTGSLCHMDAYGNILFPVFFLNMGARVAGSRRKIVGAIQGGEKLIDAPTKSYIMWSPYWTFQIAWVQSSGSLKPLQTSGFNKESMFTFRCGIAFPKRLRPKFFLRSEGCWFYSRLVVGEHLKKPAIGDQFSFSATSFLNGIR